MSWDSLFNLGLVPVNVAERRRVRSSTALSCICKRSLLCARSALLSSNFEICRGTNFTGNC